MFGKGLFAYSVGVSAALVLVLLTGSAARHTNFEEITVQRINVMEPDGTVRVVISGAQEPIGVYAHNVERSHTSGGRPAGVFFMNDEGTEVGGLIYSGYGRADGPPFSMVQFSMDNYDQDQALMLRHIQDQGILTGMIVNDVPSTPYDYDALDRLSTLEGDERSEFVQEIRDTGVWDSKIRMFAGRSRDGDSAINLFDAEGRIRLNIAVSEEGTVGIQIFDEHGSVVRDLAAVE